MTSKTDEINELNQRFFSLMGFCRNPDRLARDPLRGIDDEGRTALHLAVIHGNKGLVEELIENNANLNFKDRNNRTSLFYAVEGLDAGMVRLLLRNGANPNPVDQSGSTPLDLIVKSSDSDAEVTAPDVEIADLLLEYGANPNIREKSHKWSSLVYALLKDPQLRINGG